MGYSKKKNILRGKFILINTYTKKTSNNQLTLHIKKIEKKKTMPKVSRRKEILKKQRRRRRNSK